MIDANFIQTARGRPPNPTARMERCRQILDAAHACFVESGFAAASMSKIAEAAGVNIASIYQYFENKEALIHELVRESFELDIKKIRMLSSTGFEIAKLHTFMEREFCEKWHIQSAKFRQEVLSEASRNQVVAKLLIEAEETARIVVAEMLVEGKASGALPEQLCVETTSRNIILFHAGVATRLAIAPEDGPDLARQFAAIMDHALNPKFP